MKLLLLAAIAVSAPAIAQDTQAGHGGHSAAAAPAPAATPAPAARFTLDTPLGELMATPTAKAVVDDVLPGIEQHPSYEMAKSFGLRQIAGYADGAITEEQLARIETGLAAIK